MVYRTQLIIAGIILLVMIVIIVMIRQKKIDLKYSLNWLVLLCISLLLDVFPQILIWFSKLFGINLPSNMVFMVSILFLVMMVFSLTASVSRLSNKTKRLTQEIALLREEIERMKEAPKNLSENRDSEK